MPPEPPSYGMSDVNPHLTQKLDPPCYTTVGYANGEIDIACTRVGYASSEIDLPFTAVGYKSSTVSRRNTPWTQKLYFLLF